MNDKKIKARLILEDGTRFKGYAFGHIKEAAGEVIFSTRITGYQEMLTDPSLYGQILVMSYPLIGNVGINLEDMESKGIKVKGLIIREQCEYPNNWRCEIELDDFLKQNRVIGLEGIDTRALTRLLRDKGTMKGIITTRADELTPSQINQKFSTIHNLNAVKDVSCSAPYEIKGEGQHVAVIDLGIKNSIIQQFTGLNCKLSVFPFDSSAEQILAVKPDLLFISNGPGDPACIPKSVETVKNLLDKLPILGADLGHLVLACALGCEVTKMKFGHHGANHPVVNIETGEIFITSQNHEFVVSNTPENVSVTYKNVNDDTIAGICSNDCNVSGVQFIPAQSETVKNIDNSIMKFVLKGAADNA